MTGNQPIFASRADTYNIVRSSPASSASSFSEVQPCCRVFPSLPFFNPSVHSKLADPSVGLFGLLAALLLHAVACEGQSSRLTASSSISGNQTLISSVEGDFALGFFIPNKSSGKRYLGIWDNKIPGKSIVWVANRRIPLTDATGGAVTIAEDGNLAVLNAVGTVVWSSGLAPSNATTFAELFDSGNLVLKRAAAASGGADIVVWQSFDHPTNTWLPDMKLWLDTKTGDSVRLVSWRDDQDPSPGNFSVGIDPISMLQFKIWRHGTVTIGRTDIWNGRSISADLQGVTGALVVQKIDLTEGRWLSFSFSLGKGSPPFRAVLMPSSVPYFLFWLPSTEMWIRSPSPRACWHYNRCGPNAVCENKDMAAATQPYCRCLPGFDPAARLEWDKGNHSRGCTRRDPLPCNRNEKGFRSMERLKLPDDFKLVVNANEEQCVEECLRNCNCTAYSYSNVSVMMSSSRCLVWTGDLNDLIYYKSEPSVQGLTDKGSDLYLCLPVSAKATQQITKASSTKRKTVVLATTLAVIGILLSGALACFLTTRFRGRGIRQHVLIDDLKMPNISGTEERKTMSKRLDFGSLQAATNDFSVENRLGEGGFGSVYKGKLHGGQEVAIKRLSKCSRQGFQEFRNEVEVIARLQHTNLVRLLGWCVHAKEKILIYEYMPNNSLDKFLFDPTRNEELTWPRRFNIIQGIAQGLIYLHRYSRLRIIHRDMKASNILLDDEINPKISDFGLAKIIAKNQSEGITKRVVGTVGYMSPEYAFDGLFSEKSDVFAFGVIIMEIVTGKRSKNCYSYSNETRNLLGHVWEHWKDGNYLDLVDPCMRRHFSIEEVTKCIQIGLLCTQERAFDRPTMAAVISMLDTQSVALPSPNQPAFSTHRYSEVEDSQCESYILCSLSLTATCSGGNVIS